MSQKGYGIKRIKCVLALTLAIILIMAILPVSSILGKANNNSEVHEHTFGCYDTYELTCLDISPEHIHNNECYTVHGDPVCGIEEGELHLHNSYGYECVEIAKYPVCGLEEHTHTQECLAEVTVEQVPGDIIVNDTETSTDTILVPSDQILIPEVEENVPADNNIEVNTSGIQDTLDKENSEVSNENQEESDTQEVVNSSVVDEYNTDYQNNAINDTVNTDTDSDNQHENVSLEDLLIGNDTSNETEDTYSDDSNTYYEEDYNEYSSEDAVEYNRDDSVEYSSDNVTEEVISNVEPYSLLANYEGYNDGDIYTDANIGDEESDGVVTDDTDTDDTAIDDAIIGDLINNDIEESQDTVSEYTDNDSSVTDTGLICDKQEHVHSDECYRVIYSCRKIEDGQRHAEGSSVLFNTSDIEDSEGFIEAIADKLFASKANANDLSGENNNFSVGVTAKWNTGDDGQTVNGSDSKWSVADASEIILSYKLSLESSTDGYSFDSVDVYIPNKIFSLRGMSSPTSGASFEVSISHQIGQFGNQLVKRNNVTKNPHELDSSFPSEDGRTYSVVDAKGLMTGNDTFTFDLELGLTPNTVVDGTSFSIPVYIEGKYTEGGQQYTVTDTAYLTGSIDTKLNNVTFNPRTTANSQASYQKRIAEWDASIKRDYNLSAEEFSQGMGEITTYTEGAATYMTSENFFVEYVFIGTVTGNKQVTPTFLLDVRSSDGEVWGITTGKATQQSDGTYTSVKNPLDRSKFTRSGNVWTCPFTSSIDLVATPVYTFQTNVLVRYKTALHTTSGNRLSVSCRATAAFSDVDNVDNDDKIHNVISRPQATTEASCTCASSVERYNGDIYGAYLEFDGGEDSLTKLRMGVNTGTLTAHLHGEHRQYLVNQKNNVNYASPLKTTRVDTFIHTVYANTGDSSVGGAVELGCDANGVPDYFIQSASLGIRDNVFHISSSGVTSWTIADLPEEHKDAKVEIWVTTAESPDTWVKDKEIPLASVLNRCRPTESYNHSNPYDFTFDHEDVMRVKVVYNHSWAISLIDLWADIRLNYASQTIKNIVANTMTASNLYVTAWGGIIPWYSNDPEVTPNANYRNTPYPGPEADWIGDTVEMQKAFDNRFFSKWYSDNRLQNTGTHTGHPYSRSNVTVLTLNDIYTNEFVSVSSYDANDRFLTSTVGTVVRGFKVGTTARIDAKMQNKGNVKEIIEDLRAYEAQGSYVNYPVLANSAKFYTLIPAGLQFRGIDTGYTAWNAGDQDYEVKSSNSTTATIKDLNVVENIQNTGMTLVTYTVEDLDPYNKATSNGISFDATVDVESVTRRVFPGRYTFRSAAVFYDSNGRPYNLERFAKTVIHPDNGSAHSSYSSIFAGIDNVTASSEKKVIANSRDYSIDGEASQQMIALFVGSEIDGNTYFSTESTIIPGGTYDYRLNYAASIGGVREISIYHNIEDTKNLSDNGVAVTNTLVNNTLEGIDLSRIPTNLRGALHIYYSTEYVDRAYIMSNDVKGEDLITKYPDKWYELGSDKFNSDLSALGIKSLCFYFGSTEFGPSAGIPIASLGIDFHMRNNGITGYEPSKSYYAYDQVFYTNEVGGLGGSANSNNVKIQAKVVIPVIDKKIRAKKELKGEYPANWVVSASTRPGFEYQHKLHWEHKDSTALSNVVLYDYLESKDKSRGTLCSVGVTSNRSAPYTIYGTSTVLTDEQKQTKLSAADVRNGSFGLHQLTESEYGNPDNRINLIAILFDGYTFTGSRKDVASIDVILTYRATDYNKDLTTRYKNDFHSSFTVGSGGDPIDLTSNEVTLTLDTSGKLRITNDSQGIDVWSEKDNPNWDGYNFSRTFSGFPTGYYRYKWDPSFTGQTSDVVIYSSIESLYQGDTVSGTPRNVFFEDNRVSRDPYKIYANRGYVEENTALPSSQLTTENGWEEITLDTDLSEYKSIAFSFGDYVFTEDDKLTIQLQLVANREMHESGHDGAYAYPEDTVYISGRLHYTTEYMIDESKAVTVFNTSTANHNILVSKAKKGKVPVSLNTIAPENEGNIYKKWYSTRVDGDINDDYAYLVSVPTMNYIDSYVELLMPSVFKEDGTPDINHIKGMRLVGSNPTEVSIYVNKTLTKDKTESYTEVLQLTEDTIKNDSTWEKIDIKAFTEWEDVKGIAFAANSDGNYWVNNPVRGSSLQMRYAIDLQSEYRSDYAQNKGLETFTTKLYYVGIGCSRVCYDVDQASYKANIEVEMETNKTLTDYNDSFVKKTYNWANYPVFLDTMDYKYNLNVKWEDSSAPFTDMILVDDLTFKNKATGAKLAGIDISQFTVRGIPVTIYVAKKEVEDSIRTHLDSVTLEDVQDESRWHKLDMNKVEDFLKNGSKDSNAEDGERFTKGRVFCFWIGSVDKIGKNGYNDKGSYIFDTRYNPIKDKAKDLNVILNMEIKLPYSVNGKNPLLAPEVVYPLTNNLHTKANTPLGDITDDHKVDGEVRLPEFKEWKYVANVNFGETDPKTCYNDFSKFVNNTSWVNSTAIEEASYYAYKINFKNVGEGLNSTDIMIFDSIEETPDSIRNTGKASQFHSILRGVEVNLNGHTTEEIPYMIFVNKNSYTTTDYNTNNLTVESVSSGSNGWVAVRDPASFNYSDYHSVCVMLGEYKYGVWESWADANGYLQENNMNVYLLLQAKEFSKKKA